MDIAFYIQNFGWVWFVLFAAIGFNLAFALRHEFREPAVRDYARKGAWAIVVLAMLFNAAHTLLYGGPDSIRHMIGWLTVGVIEFIIGAALALVYLRLRPKTGPQ